MKITASKIVKELADNYGWERLIYNRCPSENQLIRDMLKVVNKILIQQKGISIK